MKSETGPPKVFISSRESVCDECGDELGHHAWIVLAGERGALCLGLLQRFGDRHEARREVAGDVSRVRAKWGRE